MSEASDKAKAAADRIVTTVEGLIAAVQKAVADLANANSANDPAFTAIADELNAEADKAGAALTPPADPVA